MEDEGVEYRVLSGKDLMRRQQANVQQVREVLSISEAFARTLLRHYKWDSEKLIEQFFELGKEIIYKRAGVAGVIKSSVTGTFTCPLCFNDVDSADTLKLSCGHHFCNECWQTYIKMRIKEGQSKQLYCMGLCPDSKPCTALFDDSKLPMFVDKDTLDKYVKVMMNSYVDDNPSARWCVSAPFCGHCIELVTFRQAVEVQCECGLEFCFKCGEAPHTPASCEMQVQWKSSGDSETANWFKSHTKPCPKCHNLIERRDGCNLMTCRCGQYFCWLCGAPTGFAHDWTKIENHECGRYKEDTDKAATAAQNSLQRYMFYYERFSAHDSTRQMVKQMEDLLEQRRRDIRAKGIEPGHFITILEDAHVVIVKERSKVVCDVWPPPGAPSAHATAGTPHACVVVRVCVLHVLWCHTRQGGRGDAHHTQEPLRGLPDPG
eukprot:TRINITY_DN2594_c0_g1_i6.p1 TRINITY_DN2594_c0_g1~~TRINITY_DN2594_c0_g1_i6.p1  ORF type:complete len:455 (-),score=84.35 TRINITY_DN2594_c0_g1_i6:364-1659(-)